MTLDEDPFVRKHRADAIAARKLREEAEKVVAERQKEARLKAKSEAIVAGQPKPYKPQFPI